MLTGNSTSEFIKADDAGATVQQIIEAKSPNQPAPPLIDIDGLDVDTTRPIVLVFHDASQDLEYLKLVGYDISHAENVIEMVDTREMHQHLRRQQNPSSLETVLGDLGLQCHDLHNAGNDAVYTLQAMIGIAIRKRIESLKEPATRKGPVVA